jgi:hypothetical protein
MAAVFENADNLQPGSSLLQRNFIINFITNAEGLVKDTVNAGQVFKDKRANFKAMRFYCCLTHTLPPFATYKTELHLSASRLVI